MCYTFQGHFQIFFTRIFVKHLDREQLSMSTDDIKLFTYINIIHNSEDSRQFFISPMQVTVFAAVAPAILLVPVVWLPPVVEVARRAAPAKPRALRVGSLEAERGHALLHDHYLVSICWN